MRRSTVVPLALLTAALLLWATGSVGAGSSKPAPDFTLTTLDGQTITKASLAGKPALLMFWASWCQTCQHELPNLKTLYEQKRTKGLQAVAIGFRDQEAGVKDYVASHAATFVFPTAYDVKDRVSTTFGARGTPTFVLLDGQGLIVLTHVGGNFLNNPDFQKFLQTL